MLVASVVAIGGSDAVSVVIICGGSSGDAGNISGADSIAVSVGVTVVDVVGDIVIILMISSSSHSHFSTSIWSLLSQRVLSRATHCRLRFRLDAGLEQFNEHDDQSDHSDQSFGFGMASKLYPLSTLLPSIGLTISITGLAAVVNIAAIEIIGFGVVWKIKS